MYCMCQNFPLDQGSAKKNAAWRTTSGLVAGVFATLFTHPVDVVRARLTVQDHLHKQYTGDWGVCIFSVDLYMKLDLCLCYCVQTVYFCL